MQILENDEIWSVEDFQKFKNVEKRLELVWKEDALKNKRVYNSMSRTTQRRKLKAEEELKTINIITTSSFFSNLQACLLNQTNLIICTT